MMLNKGIEVLTGNTLEIHYWFTDNSHTMDALIQNKCEHEILEIIKEVSQIFSCDLSIETEPIGEGGLRRWFRIAHKEENKKSTITTAIITAIITAILVTPLAKTSEKLIDKLFEDKEISALDKRNKELDIDNKELDKEKKKLEIEKLKQEVAQKQDPIENNLKIKKKKSNFYQQLGGYDKVEKVSYVLIDRQTKEIQKEDTVLRADFTRYVLIDDNLPPEEIEGATIEIISPVLIKKGYKWMGYYNSQPISFSMNSKEFKKLVLNGSIEFKNGSSIDCLLKIKSKINNEGQKHINGYEVVRVNSYFENQKLVETKEGKKYRQIKENSGRSQLDLFGNVVSNNDQTQQEKE
jgi:hypothetical protein